MANKPGVLPMMGDVTPATRNTVGRALGRRRAPTRRRRKRSSNSSRSPKRKRATGRRSGKRRGRLVKGSAAAKRYMASIRKKRR